MRLAKSPAVTGIALSASTAALSLAGTNTAQLAATLSPTGASGEVTWASSDSTKATVSDNGLVTGVAEGSATITATCGAFSATCSVTVSA